MTAADTFDYAVWVLGIVTLFYLAGLAMDGRLRRKYRKIRKHRTTY